MPRKIYDLPETEPTELQKEQAKNIFNTMKKMGAFENEPINKCASCSDPDCIFYFDLGDSNTIKLAAERHELMTGHIVILETI